MTDERDVVAEVEAALALYDEPVSQSSMRSSVAWVERGDSLDPQRRVAHVDWHKIRALVTRCEQAEQECDRVSKCCEAWERKTVEAAELVTRCLNENGVLLQECDTLKAEVERLTKQIRHIEDVVCVPNQFRAYPDGVKTREVSAEKVGAILMRLAAHEQDIEAAFRAGWCEAETHLTWTSVTVDEALARFRASRKGGA